MIYNCKKMFIVVGKGAFEYLVIQLYNCYYQTSKFHKKIRLFNQYKSTDSDLKLAFYILDKH